MFFRDYTIKVTDLPVERGGKLVRNYAKTGKKLGSYYSIKTN